MMSCHPHSYWEGAAGAGVKPGFLTHPNPGQTSSLISAELSAVQLLRKGPYLLGAFLSYRPCQTPSPASSTTGTSHFLFLFVFPEPDTYQVLTKSFQTDWFIHRQAPSLLWSPAHLSTSGAVTPDSFWGPMFGKFFGGFQDF